MHNLWPAFWSLVDPPRPVFELLRERFVSPLDFLEDDWSDLEAFLRESMPHALSELEKYASIAGGDALLDEARSLASVGARWMDVPLTIRPVESLPEELAKACSSPYVLIAGNAELVERRGIGLVGTRKLDVDESRRTQRLVERLVEAWPHPVVSGGALGVDTIAHRAAIEHGRAVMVCLAGGIRQVGPRGNRGDFLRIVEAGGALITERPPRSVPRRFEFLRRNGLIAAASDTVVVIRAPERSGALSTARAALSIGVPVYAVPGRPEDPLARGCNKLLANGARPYLDPEDLSSVLGERQRSLCLAPEPKVHLTDAQARVRDAINPAGATVDELASRSGLSVTKLQAELMELELLGVVSVEPGDRVRRLR